MDQIDLSLKAEINLYYDLFIPEGAHNAPLLIAVHGYGAHKRYMMREAKLVSPRDFVIASVQGPHQHFRQTNGGYRIGFGWLTEHKPEEYVRLHHDFLLRIIDKLAGEGLVDASNVYLYGFSQSCALNFRFAFSHPGTARAIVAACGGIPGDLDTNADYRPFPAETFYLYGDDDAFYELEKFESHEQRLRSMLPNFRSKQYRAKHEITDEMREDIKNFFADLGSGG